MKTPLIAFLVCLTLTAGCSSESDPAPSSPSATQAPATDEPALPTPQEEAAKAADSIDSQNADEELARLQAELGGG